MIRIMQGSTTSTMACCRSEWQERGVGRGEAGPRAKECEVSKDDAATTIGVGKV